MLFRIVWYQHSFNRVICLNSLLDLVLITSKTTFLSQKCGHTVYRNIINKARCQLIGRLLIWMSFFDFFLGILRLYMISVCNINFLYWLLLLGLAPYQFLEHIKHMLSIVCEGSLLLSLGSYVIKCLLQYLFKIILVKRIIFSFSQHIFEIPFYNTP